MNIAIINTTDKIYLKEDFKDGDINIVNTRTLYLKGCNGCFGCWLATPGLCVQKDNMPEILQTIMNSDLTIYITDVKAGFISSELKKVIDKTIPLMHPYYNVFQSEMHHKSRYDNFPQISLVLIDDKEISEPVFDIIKNWFTRLSYNNATNVRFVIKDDSILGRLNNEVSNY